MIDDGAGACRRGPGTRRAAPRPAPRRRHPRPRRRPGSSASPGAVAASGSRLARASEEVAVDGSHLLVATGRGPECRRARPRRGRDRPRRRRGSSSTAGSAPPTSASTRSATSSPGPPRRTAPSIRRRLVLRAIARPPAGTRAPRAGVPFVAFTDPAARPRRARRGRGAAAARDDPGAPRLPFAENDLAQAERTTAGADQGDRHRARPHPRRGGGRPRCRRDHRASGRWRIANAASTSARCSPSPPPYPSRADIVRRVAARLRRAGSDAAPRGGASSTS